MAELASYFDLGPTLVFFFVFETGIRKMVGRKFVNKTWCVKNNPDGIVFKRRHEIYVDVYVSAILWVPR